MKKEANQSANSKHSINWFLVTIVLIVGYCSYILVDQQITISALNTDIEVAKDRLTTAKNENQQLKDENTLLSDDAYVEKLAREELGMTRQGEMPYIYAVNK